MTIHKNMFDKKEKDESVRLVPPSIWTDRTVMVSGGFDPIHGGHVQMITEAAKHGSVIVVANSDE